MRNNKVHHFKIEFFKKYSSQDLIFSNIRCQIEAVVIDSYPKVWAQDSSFDARLWNQLIRWVSCIWTLISRKERNQLTEDPNILDI
jgi:hypothetical protein